MCEEGRRHRSLGVWAQPIRRSLRKKDSPRAGPRDGDQRVSCFTRVSTRGGALHKAALLDCGGSTPSGSRDTAPIHSRYEMHLDTPSLKPASAMTRRINAPVRSLKETPHRLRTNACPVFERTH